MMGGDLGVVAKGTRDCRLDRTRPISPTGRTIEDIDRRLAAENYPFQSFIYEVVRSLPFQSRRGEAAVTQAAPKTKEAALR